MAMLRTRRLAAGDLVVPQRVPIVGPRGANKLVYTVPAGVRAIIRDIRIWVVGLQTEIGDVIVGVRPSGSTSSYYVWRDEQAKAGMMHKELGADIVLHEGDKLEMYSFKTLMYYFSGAEVPIFPENGR